jgi:sugar phosphate isomerase/epimerase
MQPSRPQDSLAASRRDFLLTAAGAGLAFVGNLCPQIGRSAEPPQRTGKPYMKLSLAAYSFNRLLPRNRPLAEFDRAKMTLDDFVDFCAKLDLDGCEPTAYYFPSDVDAAYLLHLKEKAFRLGLDISGTAIGNDFCLPEGEARDQQLAMTRTWIDRAAVLGAPVIRIFAGNVPQGDTEDAAIERCIAGINDSLQYAAEKGVCLALENHGGITATPEQMLKIVHGVTPSPWFGVNFDSGNFQTADPYADLVKIAPYTINAQVKVEMSPGGRKQPADLARVVGILRDAGYRGYLVLEYEAAEDPYQAIPGYIDELRTIIEA